MKILLKFPNTETKIATTTTNRRNIIVDEKNERNQNYNLT